MAVDKRFLQQQILAQLDRCTAMAYAAGSHFAKHGEHVPASIQAQAEADARMIHLIEDYATVASIGDTPAPQSTEGALVCQACAGDAPGGKCRTKGCVGGPIVEEVAAGVAIPRGGEHGA